MKNKIFFVLMITQFFFLANLVCAQTKKATASPTMTTTEIVDDDIQNFKDKIASKVAQLTKEEQKATSGFVVKTGTAQLSIKTVDNQTYQIKVDDILTKIYQINNAQKKEIQPSQIKKDDYLIVNGPTSETTITANYIFVDESYLVNVGRVTEIDKENYSLKVSTSDKESVILDIEATTKRLILDIKTLELVTTGFSKIKEGDTVHFVVKKQTGKEELRFSAIKILIIPQEYFIK